MKAARILLEKGVLPDECPAGTPPDKIPEPLTKEKLRDIAWAAVALTIDRLKGHALGSDEATAVVTDFIRGAGKVAPRSFVLAAAMLTRLHYFGPSWATEAVRRAIPTAIGGEALQTALAAAAKNIAKVDRLAVSE